MTKTAMKQRVGRALDNFYFDWVSAVLATLFGMVSFASVHYIHEIGEVDGGVVSSNPYDWTAIVLILSGMVIGAIILGSMHKIFIKVYEIIEKVVQEYAPSWLKRLLSFESNHIWLIPAAIVNFYAIGTGLQPALLLITVAFEVASILELFWIPFNLIAIGLSITIAVVIGRLMAPVIIISLLAGVAIVDHIEVNMTDIMDSAAMAAVDWSVPNIIVIPTTWQFKVGDLKEKLMNQDEDNNIGTLIGAGDFALPAALPASVSLFTGSTQTIFNFTLPVIASIAGIVIASIILRSRVENRGETTPGIPYLASGAIIGLFIGSFIASDPIPVILGLHDAGQTAFPFIQ